MSDTRLLRPLPIYTPDFYRMILHQARFLVQELNTDPEKPLPFVKHLDDAFHIAILKMVPSEEHTRDIPFDRNLIQTVKDTRDRLQRFDQRVLFAFMGATRESMSYPLHTYELPLGRMQVHWNEVRVVYQLVSNERDASELYKAFVSKEFNPPETSRDVVAFAEECKRASERIRDIIQKLDVILDRISMGVTTLDPPPCACQPRSANPR